MDKAFEFQDINELSLVVSNSMYNGVLYPFPVMVVVSAQNGKVYLK